MQRQSTLMCHGYNLTWKPFAKERRLVKSTICFWRRKQKTFWIKKLPKSI
ncbi:hypothetical protein HanRHA438_Chr02g0049801 [Helianthus annuus]|nr:hypothetical protein HanRHA438_Chr02g0049801 [Helianthus annuus]